MFTALTAIFCDLSRVEFVTQFSNLGIHEQILMKIFRELHGPSMTIAGLEPCFFTFHFCTWGKEYIGGAAGGERFDEEAKANSRIRPWLYSLNGL